MNKFALTILLNFLFFTGFSQKASLPIPLDIQAAYKNGARSYDGKPGDNYWQNHASYDIRVYLDPERKTISGSETVVYSNNSPDTLKTLVVRLYQDLYKKGAQRDFEIKPTDLHDGTALHKLSINGTPLKVSSLTRAGAHVVVPIAGGLMPDKKITLEIDWSYPVSQASTIREGYYKASNGFFIGYWYPQISVYDDVWGWNQYSYTGMQEFYNDFNDYKVEISTPPGYVVWATGVLQNPEDNFTEGVMKKYLKALQPGEPVRVIAREDYQYGGVTQPKDTLKWIYFAENVPDFAFAASDRYLWDAATTVLNERNILIGAAYHEKSADFYEVAEIARKAITFFSNEMPGVDYPYPAMTVFNGQGGMEFPMMVNDGSAAERWATVHVTSHEIAHTYFPFYTGINEQQFAFMDEGWAIMLPFEFQSRQEPSFDPIARAVDFYEAAAGRSHESQLILPSISLSGHVYRQTYRNSAYYKSGLAYYFLKDALGDELFAKCLHEYIRRWKGKHPLPWDFFFTFNDTAGEDLSWFWKPWFLETGYPDLAIEAVSKIKSKQRIVIKNEGSIPVPVALQIKYSDGTEETIRKSAAVWKTGTNKVLIDVDRKTPIQSILLGDPRIPDVCLENNLWAS